LQYVHKNVDEWVGHKDDRLDGFSWKGGSDKVTLGVHMWSDIFTHDYDDGRKIAIILLDTQGTFDSESTMKDCSTVFALSTLVSSVQIYNLMGNVQEDDLQHLQLFSAYGQIVAEAAKESEECKEPFQKLVFLVRDWPWIGDHTFGSLGGQEFIEKRLKTYENQAEENRSVREHIKSLYHEIKGFLMPHPGIEVATNQDCQLKLSDVDSRFKKSLLELVPLLFAPENLVTKKINQNSISVGEFLAYFKKYFEVLNSSDLPTPMTVFQATAEVYNMNVINEGKNFYATRMTEFYKTKPLTEEIIKEKHEIFRTEAVEFVRKRRLMGTKEMIRTCFLSLLDFIEKALAKVLERFARDQMGLAAYTALVIQKFWKGTKVVSVTAVAGVVAIAAAKEVTKIVSNFVKNVIAENAAKAAAAAAAKLAAENAAKFDSNTETIAIAAMTLSLLTATFNVLLPIVCGS
jgi:atlastin